jgi:hypothetical protein
VKPVHKGGTDTPENLVDLDFIEHAKIHAERFLAGEDEFFDNRHTGWPYLPEDLRSKVLKKQGEKTREMNLRKAEEGTHPFQTEEFRKENSKRTRERNLELSSKDMHPAQIASREGRHPWQTEDSRDKARVRMINLNKDKIEKLVELQYLSYSQIDDKFAIQLALIMMAEDTLNQIINAFSEEKVDV